MFRSVKAILLFACVMLIIGCQAAARPAGDQPSTPVNASPDKTSEEPDQPASARDADTGRGSTMMIREANLPEGFPKPGPAGTVVLKTYPAHRLARVTAGDQPASSNGMFRPLFRHIKKNNIKMTAPVEMVYDPTPQTTEQPTDHDESDQALRMRSMAFFYASAELGEVGQDGAVRIIDVQPQTVASIGMRGDYTASRLEWAVDELDDWITQQREAGRTIRVIGPPRYMGYNSPFVPGFLKFGEVQLPVEVADDAKSTDDNASPNE